MRHNRLARSRTVSFNFTSGGVVYTSCLNGELEVDELIPWTKIELVAAYKRDVFSYDLICIGLDISAFSYETNEEMVCWTAYLKELPKYLPGCLGADDWYEAARLPPFARNWTILYTRETTSDPAARA
jgi:hypothetical protein